MKWWIGIAVQLFEFISFFQLTDITKIRNKERIRKRELAKAERRLKRNEVVEMNNSTTFDADEQDGVDKVYIFYSYVAV